MDKSFIVIRNYTNQDELQCQVLVRDYVMSFAKKSFYSCCFKEITLQIIVISWALLFIFLGVPLTFCVLTIPGCILLIFISTFCSCYSKAIELMQTKPNQSLVAECYEPYLSFNNKNNYRIHIFLNYPPYEKAYINKFRKKIVGTISIKDHNALYNAGWIYRFAIHCNYSFSKIGEAMLNLISKQVTLENGYRTLEVSVSEFQEDERDLYNRLGFETRQIYHKQIIGNNITFLKSQLYLDLIKDVSYQKQN